MKFPSTIVLTFLCLVPTDSLAAHAVPEPADYASLVRILDDLLEYSQALLSKRWIDYSEEAVRSRLERLSEQRRKLETIRWQAWPVPDRVDFLLVRAELDRAEFEYRIVRPWQRDPGLYVDIARDVAFTDVDVLGNQLEEFRENLERIPGLLSEARERLHEASPGLAGLALHNLRYSDGVEHAQPYRPVPPAGVLGWYADLVERVEARHPGLLESANLAARAVQQFDRWLEEQIPSMKAPTGVGEENYLWYLQNVEFQPFSALDILSIGERELGRTLAALALERQRNRALPPLDPAHSEEDYRERIARADRHVRDFITANRFLTIPPFIGELGDNVPWKIRAGGKRNFWEEIQYRDPLPDKVHAGIPGHRFDLAIHEHDQRPVRGKVTSANRIEGWGFYLEEAMMTAGLLDERPRTRELFYIFGAARAVRNKAEVMLHSNRWNVEEAVRYMVENVPYMDEAVARVDCEIYLRQPGYGQSYQMGKVQIERLLAERAAQLGAAFDLGSFHDQFLEAGTIPVSLIRWQMTGRSDEIDGLLESYRPLSQR